MILSRVAVVVGPVELRPHCSMPPHKGVAEGWLAFRKGLPHPDHQGTGDDPYAPVGAPTIMRRCPPAPRPIPLRGGPSLGRS